LLATLSQLLAAAEEDRVSTRALEFQRLHTLGGISSGLANELNNPVSFVSGSLELARKKCHELGLRLDGQDLVLLHEVERLIHHGMRGASRVAEVVQSASAMPLGESGRAGAIDVDFESDQTTHGSGFSAASFGRPTPVELGSTVIARPPEGGFGPREKPEPTDMTQRARILVIDDEQLMCELLGTMLSDDHEVETLSNAREALAKLQAGTSYDLILCDLMMPELTGMDLHAELLRLRPEQAARMVFMTGGTFTDRAQQFLAEHGRVQLQKPFRHDELLALVSARLAELKRSAQSNLH
jgi:CheY-like chemotaxis protein